MYPSRVLGDLAIVSLLIRGTLRSLEKGGAGQWRRKKLRQGKRVLLTIIVHYPGRSTFLGNSPFSGGEQKPVGEKEREERCTAKKSAPADGKIDAAVRSSKKSNFGNGWTQGRRLCMTQKHSAIRTHETRKKITERKSEQMPRAKDTLGGHGKKRGPGKRNSNQVSGETV